MVATIFLNSANLLQNTPYLFNCPLNSHAESVPWVLILCPGYHEIFMPSNMAESVTTADSVI
jgi:hypothetical protein